MRDVVTPRRWAWGAALLLLCSVGGSRAAAQELRVGIPRLPLPLDPGAIVAGPELMVVRLVFQGLVEFGERGEIQAGLASQWGVSRDGLTWTFRLRPDVQFHNGAPLMADDVVTSLSRHLSSEDPRDPAVPWARLFRGPSRIVREVRRGEGGTVQIELSQPFSPLLALLAHPAFAVVTTQSDSEVRFFGTGPYRQAEQTPGRLVLVAVSANREDLRAQRLVFSEVADDAAGIAGLSPGGALDVYAVQTPPTWAALGLQVFSAPTWRMGLLALRSDRGVLARRPARQAVALALDPALVHPSWGRWAVPYPAYLPPGAWAVRDTGSPAYDLARARRLLGQAGAAEAQLTLLSPDTGTGPDAPRLAEAIRLSLAGAGIKVSVRTESGDEALRVVRQGETDLALHEATLEVNDPHFFLQPLLASEATSPGNATNVAFFRSPLLDGMLFRASQLAFRPERLRLYQRLQAHLAEEVPYIPLYVRLDWLLARPTVRGLRFDSGGIARLEGARVEATR